MNEIKKIDKYLNEKWKEALVKLDASKELLDTSRKPYYEGQIDLIVEIMNYFDKFKRL